MAKLNVSKVQLTCVVTGCTNVEDGMFLDRHHVRSQKLWVRHFEHRKSRRYYNFVKRYYEFREEDVVRICREHHEEVHDLYYRVLTKHMNKLNIPLYRMSWRQATIIMDDMEAHFHAWLQRKNSRSNVSLFRKLRVDDL